MVTNSGGTVRIALFGVGRIGVGHAVALAAIPEVRLTVCDADPARATQVAQELGAAHDKAVVTSTAQEVFAHPESYDGVVIATPTATHEELVLSCAHAGLPFFCEKPVAMDLEGTRRCIEAVHAAGIASQIGFQRRFDPAYQEARRRVNAGELGEVHRIHMLTCDQNPPPESFVAHSGGIWRDCLIHDIDALRWVTGHEVEEVFAFGAVRGADYFATHDDVDEGVALLRLDDETLVTAHTSRNNGQGYDVRMEISGTLANATVGLEPKLPLVSVEPGVTFPDDEPWVDFIARFKDCYETELRAFVEVAAGRATSPCTIDDALEALHVALAIGQARQTGRPVKVSEIRGN
ncbi:Inositol 2-dehydrogenase [Actinomyces bovis]|uniref:Inositol 2-dehydrogenase n=1 Tax=Actinomyces bovis TaxID=1658 RepID=A0ABY1VP34_9ACTO|nr:Gfo/Idh/MocA family oxidoreductase [Actinomyces bovis]SPT52828.1 Inositol 2-dehydrogenase [Actinomyces bovis]VEG54895.1 Inositol 2-dehydrogenase [Actinomyces israelii]